MCKRLFILFTSFVFVLSLAGTASAQPTGEILFEYWLDIGGTAVSDLTGAAGYPDSPDDSELRAAFEGMVDWADNYGTRVRGFVYPPADGDYTLWISGDDFIELYLSTDDDSANAALIAEVPGWTNYLEWDKYPEQMSAPITLVGGQKYYIEALMKEGGGGDSLTAGWTGPEIGTDLVVIDGAFLSPVLRLAARGPVPADGAIDYDGSSLEWSAGDGAVSHKVYLSTDATIDDADLVAETDLTIHLTALDPGLTYYWRVDEVEADGAVVEGDVWSFTTLPLEAHFPSPEDGASSQAVDVQLSWTAGKGVIMHDLYFGTDEALVAAADPSTFKGKLMDTSYDPGALELETTYYWKVDEFSVTGTNPGPVWSFTTIGSIAITDPDLKVYFNFETGEGSSVLDQSGHSNHGEIMGDAQWATGIFGGAMAFDGDGDYVDVGNSSSLDFGTGDFTIAAWINLTATERATVYAKGSDNSGGIRYTLAMGEANDNKMTLTTDDNSDKRQARGDTVVNDGVWHHVVGMRKGHMSLVYVDGAFDGSIELPEGYDLSGSSQANAYIGAIDGAADPAVVALEKFFAGTIDEVKVYNRALTDVEILALNQPHIVDVTGPADVVKGVPDNGNWPGAEHPALAIDDNTGTKYLHFDGATGASGFKVTPLDGASIVTGLTFTTANDATERDPISFELSGSNGSIDGPYELIASGDIVDFAMEAAWPRFTMNATPITFANTLAYKYYQVMFPTVRDAGSANSMQIAEVELLGVPAPIGHWPLDGDALDISGNGNDGILMGDPQFVAGMVDGAIELDGVEDYVDCGNAELFDITGEMTVAAWVKVDMFDKNWQAIVTHGDSSWRIHRSSGSDNVAWGTSGASPADITGTTNVNDGEWHHIAGVYDGAQKFLYVDGAVDASADFAGTINSSAVHSVNIGENNQATGRYFAGLIDDVRIYDKGLHPLQVRDLATPPPPHIVMISGNHDDDGDSVPDDFMWPGIFEAEGYTVDYQPGNWVELDDAKIAVLEAADLIIVTRGTNSGDYAEGDEITQWNSITTPMINSATHLVRSSRWKWMDTTSLLDLAPAVMDLADGTQIDAIDEAVGLSNFPDAAPGNGTILATGDGLPWIVEWEAGVEYYDGAGEIAGGPRVFFAAGTQNTTDVSGWGEWNLTPEGTAFYLDTVNRLLNPPAGNLLANGGFEDGVPDPWSTYGDATLEVVQESPIEGSYCLHVVVGSAGANFWDAGLQHAGHVFDAGKSYALSIWFKSNSGPFQINMKPERGADPWEGYGSQEITITDEWAEYTVNTGVIPDTVDPASITFHIAYAPGDFFVDDAKFYEVD